MNITGLWRCSAAFSNQRTASSRSPRNACDCRILATGALYALDFSNRLFSINASTGALVLLGTLPLPRQDYAYIGNMTTSLNGNGRHLFYTLEVSSGPNASGPTLFRIDPSTLQVASQALTNLSSRIIGSGFVGATLYAFTEFGEILTVDTATGVATASGRYDSGSTADAPGPPFTGIFGVVATPEPSTLWLAAAGGLAIAARRRRLRA